MHCDLCVLWQQMKHRPRGHDAHEGTASTNAMSEHRNMIDAGGGGCVIWRLQRSDGATMGATGVESNMTSQSKKYLFCCWLMTFDCTSIARM
jgi:hypothetical protein